MANSKKAPVRSSRFSERRSGRRSSDRHKAARRGGTADPRCRSSRKCRRSSRACRPSRRTRGDRPGSDFMVDVLKSLGFEYACANPGSVFRGLHESLINYGRTRTRSSSPAARGIVGGHGARLRQDRRQAADGAGARHGRTAARLDGDLQRLVRPRAGVHHPRQQPGRHRARRRDRLAA